MAPPRKNPVDEEALALLRRVGRTIYGDRWYAKMARALDGLSASDGTLDASVVRRWDLGERSMPTWVVARLVQVIEAEVDEIVRFQEELDEKRAALGKLIGQVVSHGRPNNDRPPVKQLAKPKATSAPAPAEEPEPDEDDRPAPSM